MNMMKSFRSAVAKNTRASKQREAKERRREAAKEKAESDANTRGLAPFQAAAAVLEALMKSDPDFKKFVKKMVANHHDCLNDIASTKFGKHDEQDGWQFEMIPTYKQVSTEWYLVVDISEKGKVELKTYDNCSNHHYSYSPADVPKQVLNAFQPVLKTMQDKKEVYGFLLKKFGH